jgi:hypothetical protein
MTNLKKCPGNLKIPLRKVGPPLKRVIKVVSLGIVSWGAFIGRLKISRIPESTLPAIYFISFYGNFGKIIIMSDSIVRLEPGQVRHPKRNPEALMKVIGPLVFETQIKKGEFLFENSDVFILTRDFPKYHYIVVVDIVQNYDFPDIKYCVSHLITHSPDYNNLKIISDLYDTATIQLSNSNITKDKFLVNTKDVEMKKHYGHFHLGRLADYFEE